MGSNEVESFATFASYAQDQMVMLENRDSDASSPPYIDQLNGSPSSSDEIDGGVREPFLNCHSQDDSKTSTSEVKEHCFRTSDSNPEFLVQRSPSRVVGILSRTSSVGRGPLSPAEMQLKKQRRVSWPDDQGSQLTMVKEFESR